MQVNSKQNGFIKLIILLIFYYNWENSNHYYYYIDFVSLFEFWKYNVSMKIYKELNFFNSSMSTLNYNNAELNKLKIYNKIYYFINQRQDK